MFNENSFYHSLNIKYLFCPFHFYFHKVRFHQSSMHSYGAKAKQFCRWCSTECLAKKNCSPAGKRAMYYGPAVFFICTFKNTFLCTFYYGTSSLQIYQYFIMIADSCGSPPFCRPGQELHSLLVKPLCWWPWLFSKDDTLSYCILHEPW